nr:MAG TPA: hypothetical protein [Caudoviricetes sp.]
MFGGERIIKTASRLSQIGGCKKENKGDQRSP